MYFTYFPNVNYRFGDETTDDVFRNISLYAEVVDEIKDNLAFYTDYQIQEFERPDQVSMRFYGSPYYHWLIYLMNDKLRERGWPLTNRQVVAKAKEDYPGTVLNTRSEIYDKFTVGQTILGRSSGTTATVNHRHLDLGQIIISGASGNFTKGETLQSTNADGDIETIVLDTTSIEYLSPHHYINGSGEIVDIDPTAEVDGALLTAVTYLDRLVEQNEGLKRIRMVKPSVVEQVTKAFRGAIRS